MVLMRIPKWFPRDKQQRRQWWDKRIERKLRFIHISHARTHSHKFVRESVSVRGSVAENRISSRFRFVLSLASVLHSIHFSGVERINGVRNKYNGDNTIGSDVFAKPTLIRNLYPYLYNERCTHRRAPPLTFTDQIYIVRLFVCIVVCIINNFVENLRAPTLRTSV